MERLLFDLRYALRQLVKAPGFSAAVIGIMALGVGSSTAVLSVVDSVLFRPLPFPDADRLVTLCEVHQGDDAYCTASPPNVSDWAAGTRALDAVGVARERSLQLQHAGHQLDVSAAMATPGFLAALGVQPLHGRLLQESDMLPRGSGTAVVLSYELWQGELGADPRVVGRTITASSGGDGRVLHDQPMTVVGILPPGLTAPRLNGVRAWFPLQFDPRAEEYRDWRGFATLGRLADGVTAERAARELNRVQANLAESYPAAVRSWAVQVHPLRSWLVRDIRPLLLLFLGAVAVVLVIVCVNVAGLLLARATQRERELTVRAALGARHGRLLYQLLVESAVLALLGGAAGILLAVWLVDAFLALAPPGIPRLEHVAVNSRMLAFGLSLTVVTALVAGLAPALRARGLRPQESLKASSRTATTGRRGARVRSVLVVAQLALTLALVLSAGLLLRSFSRLVAFDPGFQLDGVLTFQVFPPAWRYPTPAQLADFYARAEAAFEAIPGVTSAGTASAAPLVGGGDGPTPFLIHGEPAIPVEDAPTVQWYNAGPGYFPTLGLPILLGRNLAEREAPDATPTALITRSMAERFWGGRSPVGARLSLPSWETDAEIVGVVPDLPLGPGQSTPQPAIFVSDRQRPRGASFFVLRLSGEPATVIPAIRRTLAQLDPEVEPRSLETMSDLLGQQLVGPRFNLALIAGFALVALLLTAAGVYALMAYSVAQRTREFGIRMALGASRSSVLGSVVFATARILAAGLILGALGAYFFTRLLRGLIHDVAPADAIALAGTLIVLALTAIAAAMIPALRASRTQPAAVLSSE